MNNSPQPRSARVINAVAFGCILVAGAALGLACVAWDHLRGAPPPTGPAPGPGLARS